MQILRQENLNLSVELQNTGLVTGCQPVSAVKKKMGEKRKDFKLREISDVGRESGDRTSARPQLSKTTRTFPVIIA